MRSGDDNRVIPMQGSTKIGKDPCVVKGPPHLLSGGQAHPVQRFFRKYGLIVVPPRQEHDSDVMSAGIALRSE